MKLFLLLLSFTGLAPAGCNVIQFGSRIKHKTRKSPLSYNAYGCYCSLGGFQTATGCDRLVLPCPRLLLQEAVFLSLTSSKLVTYKYSIWGSQIMQ